MTESFHDYARITGEASSFFEWQTSVTGAFEVAHDVTTETVCISFSDFSVDPTEHGVQLLNASDGSTIDTISVTDSTRGIAAANGVLVVDFLGGGLSAYDISSQSEIWVKGDSFGINAITAGGGLALTNPGPMYAYNLDDGSQQWTASVGNSLYFPYLNEHDQILAFWNGSSSNYGNNGVDADTGNVLWSTQSFFMGVDPAAGGTPASILELDTNTSEYFISQLDASGNTYSSTKIQISSPRGADVVGDTMVIIEEDGGAVYSQWTSGGVESRTEALSGGANRISAADYGQEQLAVATTDVDEVYAFIM